MPHLPTTYDREVTATGDLYANYVSVVLEPLDVAALVLDTPALQESHWLEWKSDVDLSQRDWQARVAKFILGASNRPPASALREQDGYAYMALGAEPGRLVGTPVIDPAAVDAGLRRFLGSTGPTFNLAYPPIGGVTVGVVTVHPAVAGARPHLSYGSLSNQKGKPVIHNGRIYVRRLGSTEEATAPEVDDMLLERVSARSVAGARWPEQPVDAWRDGSHVYVRLERGDQLNSLAPDSYTNLAEMARVRPRLPSELPEDVQRQVAAILEPLTALAPTDPRGAVEAAWPPLRGLTVNAYQDLMQREPPHKVIDMVAELANAGYVHRGWVDVAYPLYYWPIDQQDNGVAITAGLARTYVSLATALATALLLAHRDGPR